MRRTCYTRWSIYFHCRYIMSVLILSLTGYFYTISMQTLRIIPTQKVSINTEAIIDNRGRGRKLSAYKSLENYTFTNTMLLNSKRSQLETNTPYRDGVSKLLTHNLRRKRYEKDTETNESKAKRLPQAIIIGVKKCGTRALLEYLRLHPDIKAPGPEPHFFDRYFHMGFDWYRDRMPLTLKYQVTMEKTPRYFVNVDAPQRIWNMSRSIKLIIVIRDPVTRAISDFTQGASKRNYLHRSVFIRKAFRANGTGDVNTHWSIINTGLYVQHLKRWLQYFPLSQMYFVSGENLISNPAKELECVQKFLGVQPVISNKNFYFNVTKGFPCLLKLSRKPTSRCFNSSKGRQHLDLDNNTLEKLRTFYDPYNKNFYNLTGRQFGW